ATVLTHDAAMDFPASKGKSMILNRIDSAVVAPPPHNHEHPGVLLHHRETHPLVQPHRMPDAPVIPAPAPDVIHNTILGKKSEQEPLNGEPFSRLLSPNVAQRVLCGALEVKKGGQLVEECTVFNSDIRGFTRMSEGANPSAVVDMMNEYFEQMVEVVFKYE